MSSLTVCTPKGKAMLFAAIVENNNSYYRALSPIITILLFNIAQKQWAS